MSLHDPSGLSNRYQPGPQLFDRSRLTHQPRIPRESTAVPDALLIATLVELGAPRWFAEQVRVSPELRYAAMASWCLVQDAREGASVQHAGTGEWCSARELVDAMREQYAMMRKIELVSDRPEHTIGLWER